MCASGDLSGRYGYLNSTSSIFSVSDAYLSLYGAYSIIGRSLVLNWNSTLFACANIGYPAPSQTVLYAPFRVGFAGNVYLSGNYGNSTAVFVDLYAVNGLVNSSGHNWHVHVLPTSSDNCTAAGGHYNPLGIHTGGNYSLSCGPTAPEMCEIGDLSSKGGQLNVTNGMARLLYSDLLLPLLPQDGNPLYIVGRSVVVHGPGGSLARLACANISLLTPLDALARFNTNGVMGTVRFRQATPFDFTMVMVSLTGLGGMASGYHINALPVQSGGCSGAGDVWDSTSVSVGVASTPLRTSDQFKVGDLSGKFGSLDGMATVNYTFSDPNLSLFGQDSIIGRSLVLSFSNGSAWVCANVQHSTAVLQSTVNFTASGFIGSLIFSQPSTDPFAATTIVVEFAVFPDPSLPSVTSSSILSPLTSVLSPLTSVLSLVSATSEVTSVPAVTSVPSGVPSGVTSASGMTSIPSGVTSTVPTDTSISLLGSQVTSYLLTTSYGLVPSPTPTDPMGKREVPVMQEFFQRRAKRQQSNGFSWSLQSGGCGSATFNPFNSR